MRLIDREYVRSLMPRRDPAGHKGTFGKVYLLGGSVGYTTTAISMKSSPIFISYK